MIILNSLKNRKLTYRFIVNIKWLRIKNYNIKNHWSIITKANNRANTEFAMTWALFFPSPFGDLLCCVNWTWFTSIERDFAVDSKLVTAMYIVLFTHSGVLTCLSGFTSSP